MNLQFEHLRVPATDQDATHDRIAGPGDPPVSERSIVDRLTELEHELATIRAALESRDVIGMAKGILMAREGCTPDEAFDTLRRASQRANAKLTTIAAQLVEANAGRGTHSSSLPRRPAGGRHEPGPGSPAPTPGGGNGLTA